MKSWLWPRFLAISLVFALVLTALYMALVRQLAGPASNEVQRSLYLFVARMVEKHGSHETALAEIDALRAESPALRMDLWIVNEKGRVLADNLRDLSHQTTLPDDFEDLEWPRTVHEVVSRGRFFSRAQALALVRLQGEPPTYLAVRNPGAGGISLFGMLGIFFMASLALAMFLGLLLVTLYLRSRSAQARQVIRRMNAGDLAARFLPGRLDAAGQLMQEFNRMADEIERLVHQLQATERARRELLQELGHDLRTPLTSLRTAIDTLAAHGQTMPEAERAQFIALIANEFTYFRKLTDDLFFIAALEQPGYRQQARAVDLAALAQAELESLRRQPAQQERGLVLTWEDTRLTCVPVAGDAHLLSRLLRNVLENAARHARFRVDVRLASQGKELKLTTYDDGPGMSAADMAAFGRRRSSRLIDDTGGLSASLGLGSVIIRTIAELHGGRVELSSGAGTATGGEGGAGTCVLVFLPTRAG